jgi:hypothetical protein
MPYIIRPARRCSSHGERLLLDRCPRCAPFLPDEKLPGPSLSRLLAGARPR